MSDTKACACSVELTEKEMLTQVDGVLADYKAKPGALIPVLQISQTMFGYLPQPVLRRIATGLNKPFSEVAGVVGFYSFFSTVPRGRYLVRICLGTACYVRGGKQILDAVKKCLGIDVGETTPDRMFSLEVARCFGACGLAPVMMIDNDTHQRVKAAKVQEILDKYINAKKTVSKKGATK